MGTSLYHRNLGTGEPTQVVAQYVWGVRPGHRDELILRDRDTTGDGTLDERLYCLMDYFNPVAVVDAEGEVKERYAWSAFGLRTVMGPDWAVRAESVFAWDFGFHGQFVDAETGYYDYGYRYYSPDLGKWISRDPIGEAGGTNMFLFAFNCPTGIADHLGLQGYDVRLYYDNTTPKAERAFIRSVFLVADPKTAPVAYQQAITNLQYWFDSSKPNNSLLEAPPEWWLSFGSVIKSRQKLHSHLLNEVDNTTLGGLTICDWGKNELKDKGIGDKVAVPAGVWFETLNDTNQANEPALFYATGDFTMKVFASGLTVCKKEDGYYLSGTVDFSVRDPYNWDTGKDTPFPTPLVKHALTQWAAKTGNPMPKLPTAGGLVAPFIGFGDSFFQQLAKEGLGKDYIFGMTQKGVKLKNTKCP